MFGESLQDALAAIEFVTNGQNDDDDISDSDSEPESSSIVEPASSPTIYSSTPPTSSNHSLQVLVESDPGDDADDDISTEYSELTGFKREGKSKEEKLVDITVMDHGTHTVTRTLIRPLKTRKRNALGFFTSLVSPEPVRTTLSRPRPVKSYLNLKLMGSSNGPSGELVCRPTSPVFSFLTNHAANTLALGGLTRPSTPTTTNTTTITTTTTPESQRIFPFLLNNPLFEEDIDTREEQWTKEKSGTGAIEIFVKVEIKVTVEETSSDESDKDLSLGFTGVQGVRGVVREFGLGLYAPEREYPRGLLGPRDQPRRRVFSPPPMRRS